MKPIRHFCTFEDRADALIGIKLLALSLERHCRSFRFWILLRHEPPGFQEWLAHHAPSASLLVFNPVGNTWNIKAEILMRFLADHAEITWIDSDIIVLRDLEELWAQTGNRMLVAQQFDFSPIDDPVQDLTFGQRRLRSVPFAVNSCVLRFTRSHLPLLEAWNTLLLHPDFLTEQQRKFADRRLGLQSDQELLEYALCTVDEPELDPPAYVRTGIDIIQDHGATTYDFGHRLRNVLGWNRPFFVHALGTKPWGIGFHRKDSAYVEFAQDYSSHLDDRLKRQRGIWRALGLRNGFMAHIIGIPRCLGGKIVRLLKTGSLQRAQGQKLAGTT